MRSHMIQQYCRSCYIYVKNCKQPRSQCFHASQMPVQLATPTHSDAERPSLGPADSTIPVDFVSGDPPAQEGQQGSALRSLCAAASPDSAQILFGISSSDAQCVCLLLLPAPTKQHDSGSPTQMKSGSDSQSASGHLSS